MPFIAFVLYRAYGRLLTRSLKVAVALILLLVVTLAYAIPSLGVQSRVNLAIDQVHHYVEGDRSLSSVGARFEMWRGASHLIAAKPLFGWGKNGYASQMQRLADQGVIAHQVARYDHAHNQFIDAWAKRGLLGLLALIALYLVPMRLFISLLSSQNMTRVSVAAAGVLLPVTYIDFSLTQGFLNHNSGTMVYAFWCAVFYGLLPPSSSASR
ncbi:O-antigen ligase family protein [Vreelandella azerica]|uniref:O-antigen ligase family protein n=1 Tax=Vreelandella azerica TaxID=2732867 RepID=UPI002E2C81A2|nr:O-antigen ligase family protein [Halomonas azerica]